MAGHWASFPSASMCRVNQQDWPWRLPYRIGPGLMVAVGSFPVSRRDHGAGRWFRSVPDPLPLISSILGQCREHQRDDTQRDLRSGSRLRFPVLSCFQILVSMTARTLPPARLVDEVSLYTKVQAGPIFVLSSRFTVQGSGFAGRLNHRVFTQRSNHGRTRWT